MINKLQIKSIGEDGYNQLKQTRVRDLLEYEIFLQKLFYVVKRKIKTSLIL